jgi:hypothetical protein
MAVSLSATSGLPDLALKLASTGASIIAIAILWNTIRQIFLKNPHEPPLVFHWVPIIGSTVTYGIDPIKFFARCQAKVRYLTLLLLRYSSPLQYTDNDNQ